jgi:protein-S-isoprenylcysteine O-methyltransferase
MSEQPILRVFFFALFLVALIISGFYRRRARARSGTIARSQEGGLAVLGRLIIVLPLLASLLLYPFAPRTMAWASLDVPDWVRGLGVFLGLLVIPLIVWVFRSIGANISETVLTKADHHLVTQGPYRWVRHPLYTTGLLLIFSLALVAGSWFLAGLSLVGLLVFRLVVIPAEERNLTTKFGSAYTDYQARSGALFPKL